MINIEKLQTEIRAINIANGWKVPDPQDWVEENRVPTFIALIHSEISEVAEGYWESWEENIKEELADVVIRIIDLVYGLGFTLERHLKSIYSGKDTVFAVHSISHHWLLYLHVETTKALEAFRNQSKDEGRAEYYFTLYLAYVFVSVQDSCNYMNIDLEKEIEKKLEKNKARGIRHGGKKI